MVQQQNQLTSGPTVVENFYGPPVDPRRAPEVISQAVASLPPEQMFELMKQLKTCIQNNPSQARQMLLHNPQLAYALLQAQVVMRIVEPQVAIALLYRQDPSLVTPLQPIVAPNAPASMPFSHPPIPPVVNNPLLGHVVGPMPPVSLPFPSPPMPPPNHSHPSLMFPGPMPSSQQPNVAPGQQQQSLPAIDQERANLIMQVIQLSDNQIAMLPPEQRHNILMLKEQIVNNGTPPSNVTMQQANQQ
ncbi:hypothetical protein GJ496_009585 [Pomphorhynchus laevis]|nr:hypothetical protein GJ496_009585 [Pomphorhynchus laevis]